MLTTLIALAVTSGQVSCAVMGSSAPENAKVALDYAGARFPFCCGGCDGAFAKNPTKYIKAAGDKTIAVFLFDAVSGEKVNLKDDEKKGPFDYKGTRYYFSTQANLDAFKADPKAFTKPAEKEALYCPLMKHPIASYSEAGGYVDHAGVRYYVCCGDCLAKMKENPAEYAKNAKAAVKAPVAMKPKAIW